MVKRQARAATMVLVKWRYQAEEEETSKFLFDIQKKYSTFEPCGQIVSTEEDLIHI